MKAYFAKWALAILALVVGSAIAMPAATQVLEDSPSQADSDIARADDSQSELTPGFSSLPDFAIEGVITKSERVSRYANTEWARLAKPVGLVETVNIWEGNLSKFLPYSPCTAWLVDFDLVLTAYHCIPGLNKELQATNPGAKWRWTRSTVSFNYISADSTIPRRVYDVEEIVESNKELDFAILRLRPGLSGDFPGQVFGAIRLASSIIDQTDDPLYMFHHPYGYFEMLLKDSTCRISQSPPWGEGFHLHHSCDTRGGSSGAPILSSRLVSAEPLVKSIRSQVAIGLHTNSGFGVRMSEIVAASPTLKDLACYSDPGPDYVCPPIRLRRSTVYFEWDSAIVSEDDAYEYSKVRAIFLALGGRKPARIVVTGHTDTAGSAAYNRGKSLRMARTVADMLVSLGVDSAILFMDGKGETELAVATGDGVIDGRNRRVTVVIEWPENQQ